jgi:hypothetical protein
MEENSKENGLSNSSMVSEFTNGLTAKNTKASTYLIRKTALVFINFQMSASTEAGGKLESSMASELLKTQKLLQSAEYGKKASE